MRHPDHIRRRWSLAILTPQEELPGATIMGPGGVSDTIKDLITCLDELDKLDSRMYKNALSGCARKLALLSKQLLKRVNEREKAMRMMGESDELLRKRRGHIPT